MKGTGLAWDGSSREPDCASCRRPSCSLQRRCKRELLVPFLFLLFVVAVVVHLVVVAAAAATDHRRQCSCANQARGANSRGSQQAPFLKRKGCPPD